MSHSDEDFQKAVNQSQKDHEEHERDLSKSKTEEEIVLDYVKKQSLAEEEYRKSVAAEHQGHPSDEELKKAMEQNLKLQS